MKTRKSINVFLALSMFFSALPLNCTAHAEKYESEFTAEEIDSSEIKPVLTVNSIALTEEEAMTEPLQTVTLSISGADMKYCSTGLHVYFDDRLELVPDDSNSPAVPEEAISELSSRISKANGNCIFLATSSVDDSGSDGVMWSFNFKLPEEVKDGDFFPIEVVYEKREITDDVFANKSNDLKGKLMEAWLFTHGLQNGGITISKDAPSHIPGDVNCDRQVDMSDVVLITQSLSNPDKYGLDGYDATHITYQGMINGDVCGNDGLNALDSLTICEYLLNIIAELPV